MSRADEEYRRKAKECRDIADKERSPEDKAAWLRLAEGWLARFQSEIAARAEAEGLRPRDFACTVLAAIVGADAAAFLQIGDGAMVVSCPEEPDEYVWVFWPQRGEYENLTFFATDEGAPEQLDFAFVENRIEEVAVFTEHCGYHVFPAADADVEVVRAV